jgi:transcriptional regulator with XRE-family HTH domain
MTEQKIKQDSISIGSKIREIRKAKKIGQTELAIRLQLRGIDMTRETLVKIESGKQHIYATQLIGIKEILDTSYDELLK